MIIKTTAASIMATATSSSSLPWKASVMVPPVRPLAQRILSNREFDIEFQGYLSNHAKHAIIALDRLDAPDARVQEYWDTYTTLTPYNLPLHKIEWDDTPAAPASSSSVQEFLEQHRGKKEAWQEMVLMLQQEWMASSGDGDKDEALHKLVRDHAPLDGMAGALTHGIIHLGWALDAKNPWMTLEGLAYLNFCHLPVGPDLQSNAHADEGSPLESMQRICRDPDLIAKWVTATKAKYDETFHSELVPAGFQWHLAKVLHDAHPVATELPGWLRSLPLDVDARGSVWEVLYEFVTLLYLATRDGPNGNFLVLHLLTSLWGLEQVSRACLDSEETVRQALETYWAMTICVVATSSIGIPSFAQLQDTAAQFPSTRVDDAQYSWDATVARGTAEEEEHNIKLVYVARELWRRYGGWSGYSEAAKSFTLTPNIGPSKTTFD